MFPVPYRVATPVSHHFERDDLAREVTAVSDVLELRDNAIDPPSGTSYAYHSELDAARRWTDGARDRLCEVRAAYDPDLVSLHLASRYQDHELEAGRFHGRGDPFERAELTDLVVENVERVRSVFPEVPVLLENNNHLGTDAYDVVTDPGFVDAVVRLAECGFLFDVAHAKITAANTDRPVEDYVAALPLDRCRQVHLSRHRLGPDRATDSHSFLRRADWTYFDEVRELLPNLRYVTLEYYEDAVVLLDQLERMQRGESDRVLQTARWKSDVFTDTIADIVDPEPTTECLMYALVRARERGIDRLYVETDAERIGERAASAGFERVAAAVILRGTLGSDPESGRDASASEEPTGHLAPIVAVADRVRGADRVTAPERLRGVPVRQACGAVRTDGREAVAVEAFVAGGDADERGVAVCLDGDLGDNVGHVGLSGPSAVGGALLDAATAWGRSRGVGRLTVAVLTGDPGLRECCLTAGFSHMSDRSVWHRSVGDCER